MAEPQTSHRTMIELNRVTKLYGQVIGVNDIDASLPMGAYGLIGPNGSGKTTLINLLIGHFRPTIGSLRTLGVVPSKNRSVLRRIGLCPASDVLYPNVSAFEWVKYQARLHGISGHQSKTAAETSLEITGMTGAMHRPMGTYSLGMRQRTKIAQAIAHDPDLLILDEPYNGLDPVGRSDMTKLLKQWAAQGKGMLFASHVLQEIEQVTSSFLLIHGGRLLASGTATEIQSILAETPQELKLIGQDAARLVHRLVDLPWVQSMNLGEDRRTLTVTLREPKEFFNRIACWIAEGDLSIDRMVTPDGNLETIFDSLLRHHRGEE